MTPHPWTGWAIAYLLMGTVCACAGAAYAWRLGDREPWGKVSRLPKV